MQHIKSILLTFNILTGINVAIYDLEYQEIYTCTPGYCNFCLLIKNNSDISHTCQTYTMNAFQKVESTANPIVYSCPWGLYKAIVPVFYNNRVIAYLMMGQTLLNSKSSKEQIKRLITPYFNDNSLIESAINQITITDTEKLYTAFYLLQIISDLISFHQYIKPDRSSLALIIKKYIDENFTKDITIDHICNYINYSRSHVVSSFKNEYGISIGSYIQCKRLDLSYKLLLESNLSTTEIAGYCGFHDTCYFCNAFKKHFQKSTRDIRKTNSQNKS